VVIEYVAGGLAPDSDAPMPMEQRRAIQGYWREISEKLGTEFNFDFWVKNTPRRSTYIACRAVIAAKNQSAEVEMVDAIQRAYYLRAMNPSDSEILVALAAELSLDVEQFSRELESPATHQELQRQVALARELTQQGFPSMVLEHEGARHSLVREYQDCGRVLDELISTINR